MWTDHCGPGVKGMTVKVFNMEGQPNGQFPAPDSVTTHVIFISFDMLWYLSWKFVKEIWLFFVFVCIFYWVVRYILIYQQIPELIFGKWTILLPLLLPRTQQQLLPPMLLQQQQQQLPLLQIIISLLLLLIIIKKKQKQKQLELVVMLVLLLAVVMVMMTLFTMYNVHVLINNVVLEHLEMSIYLQLLKC